MKIHYFEEGIKDDSFNSVKTMILADRKKLPDFISVMNLYSNFKQTQKNDIAPKAAPFPPSIRGVAVAIEAVAGPSVAVDVVVTRAPAGLFPKRKLTR